MKTTIIVDSFQLPSGRMVTLQHPSPMTQGDYDILCDWIELELKKIQLQFKPGEEEDEEIHENIRR
jgi:hypothetical protein